MMLLVFVGVRGAGKTTLIDRLRKREDIVVLKPTTNRAPRGDADKEYCFVQDFQPNIMAWHIKVGDHLYGMRTLEVAKARDELCVTVFDPLNLEVLTTFRRFAHFYRPSVFESACYSLCRSYSTANNVVAFAENDYVSH